MIDLYQNTTLQSVIHLHIAHKLKLEAARFGTLPDIEDILGVCCGRPTRHAGSTLHAQHLDLHDDNLGE